MCGQWLGSNPSTPRPQLNNFFRDTVPLRIFLLRLFLTKKLKEKLQVLHIWLFKLQYSFSNHSISEDTIRAKNK